MASGVLSEGSVVAEGVMTSCDGCYGDGVEGGLVEEGEEVEEVDEIGRSGFSCLYV